jgi:AcrR family transcriptional regulator
MCHNNLRNGNFSLRTVNYSPGVAKFVTGVQLSKNAVNKTVMEELFPREMSKSDKRRLQILESAIKTYATVGLQHISYDDLAQGKTSRALVKHYFPDKRDLFEFAMKFIRASFQELAVEHLSKGESAEDQLRNYVRATFHWLESRPTHAHAWLFYFYICARDSKIRKHHRELTEIGAKRIAALLEAGVAQRSFYDQDQYKAAKAIQRMITGGLIEAATETENIAELREAVVEDCLLLVLA